MIHERSLDQRLTALHQANAIRRSRSQLKHHMRHASRTDAIHTASTLVDQTPRWAETMQVRDLLLAIPQIGPAKVDRILITLRISLRKTLGGMSERQRNELLAWLRLNKAAA